MEMPGKADGCTDGRPEAFVAFVLFTSLRVLTWNFLGVHEIATATHWTQLVGALVDTGRKMKHAGHSESGPTASLV